MSRQTVAVLAVLLGFSVALFAQESRGSISGAVTDPQGAVIAGAQVTVGFEFWGAGPTGGLYTVGVCDEDAIKGPRAREISATKPRPINFGIWWDGDYLRELLDGTTISKWDWQQATTRTLLSPEGVASTNGTKATPALSGDILGDWREEVIWRTIDNTELRIYTTTLPTQHRRMTWMHDRQYRLAVAWQNVAYNQPPHPSASPGEGSEFAQK